MHCALIRLRILVSIVLGLAAASAGFGAEPDVMEDFDRAAVDALPNGWAQWSSSGAKIFSVVQAQALSAPNCLAARAAAGSAPEARAWLEKPQSANALVAADVYFNSSTPAVILARGAALDTKTPSYYAVSATYGAIGLKLLRVEQGRTTTLGEMKSGAGTWYSNKYARVSLWASGGNIRAQVQRGDNRQFLNAFGQWQAGEAWALNVQDPAPLADGGMVGVGRAAGQAGTTSFDNFTCTALKKVSGPPVVSIIAPAADAPLSGVTRLEAKATFTGAPGRVHFGIDDVLRAVVTAPPYSWTLDTTELTSGSHKATVLAYDSSQNVSLPASRTFTVKNDSPPVAPPPDAPRHYPHIRIAQVGYGGPPFNPDNYPLLKSSVDLVVTNPDYAVEMHSQASTTPKFIYTNVSSLYLDLLVDWLNFADAHGHSREEPFFHVAMATPFSGAGGSTQPVTWLWQVWTGGESLTDQTRAAHADQVRLGGVGEALILGQPDRFRELNFALASGAEGGWACELEYPSAVDSSGKPTAWTKLPLIADTTSLLKQSGQITFDPPADWKPAAVGGTARLYYVRLRTTKAGAAPVTKSILGRDYVEARGGNRYVIPAFDYAADADHDGYLNDAEYAHRRSGFDARFAYESRLLSYGQMRFATTPHEAGFRDWCVDYHRRYLARCPQAAGLFMDNSDGRTTAPAGSVIEPIGAYSTDYGSLMRRIGQAIGPRAIIANTAGWVGDSADPTVEAIQGYFEEFAMRPEADTYQRFETLAAMVTKWAKLAPGHFAIIDSYPAGGSQTDPRTLLGALAYYYLLADPKTTFLDFWGGHDPSGPWSKHWTPAVAYDIGQPKGAWMKLDSGKDPANAVLEYRVYSRDYERAIVLYKPLSYTKGLTGGLGDETATTIALKGIYRRLDADGSLGQPVKSVSLRNGEGAIMIAQ